ncbi:MAG: hypothetical protein C4293_15645 [Nitrospiraceae bacterium]
MKMLLIVFRDSLDQEIRRLLKELNTRAFTEASDLVGMGETGSTFNSFGWPGVNSIILTAVEGEHAQRVVHGLKAFRDRMARQQHGAKIPVRVFVLPCEQAI